MAPNWSDINAVRGEWPQAALDPVSDRRGFEQGLVLYERDDYPAMMQCAVLFSTALAHSLFGEGILHGDELPETVHKTIYTALCAPPDGRTFADSAQKAARLAMTIMRENGWQPPSLGGTIDFFEPMMMNKGNRLLLGTAIAPPDQPWAGDLKAFFAVPPQPAIGTLPNAKQDGEAETVHRVYDTVQQAEAGDAASALYVEGMALTAAGDYEGAIAKYSDAANLGSVDAMAEAGHLNHELGRQAQADFWYESAAHAGHAIGMFNTGIAALNRGDRPSALQWIQRAAEAGNVEGYAALTQLADEAGDDAAELHWSRLGAEAGHLFCMGRYSLLLGRDANGDIPTLRVARDYSEQAADRGDIDCAVRAVHLNDQLADQVRVRHYIGVVQASGNADAIERLRRFGYL